jgi:hypothetical protein
MSGSWPAVPFSCCGDAPLPALPESLGGEVSPGLVGAGVIIDPFMLQEVGSQFRYCPGQVLCYLLEPLGVRAIGPLHLSI